MNRYIFDHDDQVLNLSKEQVGSIFELEFKGRDIIVEVVESQSCTNCIFNNGNDCICKEKGINCLFGKIKYIEKGDTKDRLSFKQRERLRGNLGRLEGITSIMEQNNQAIISTLKEIREALNEIMDR